MSLNVRCIMRWWHRGVSGVQVSAVIVTAILVGLWVVSLPTAAFVRFPKPPRLWLLPAATASGMALALFADSRAPHPMSFGVTLVLALGLLASVIIGLLARRARVARGWLTPSMSRTRVLYPADAIGTKLKPASAHDGSAVSPGAAAANEWGGKLLLAHDVTGYSAAVTKNGYVAVVSDDHPTVDGAVSDAIKQLAQMQQSESSI